MKNTIKVLGLILFSAALFTACNKQPTIQEYYVEKQESSNFIAIDLPASLFKVGDAASPETRETMATIKKLNILAFKINDSNQGDYDKEYAQVKEILKNDNYNELMRMKHENFNIVVNYRGADDAVDEFVLFAADNSKGFALARVLGDQMKPENMIKMVKDFNNIDKEGAGEALGQLSDLFGDFNDN